MSRYFPHTPYAEDQPLGKTILTTHVLTRGFQAGSLVGATIALPIFLLRSSRTSAAATRLFVPSLLRSTGTGALIGTALMVFALPARMFNREDIEWKDRSWRLMENKGQLECDDWTYSVMGAAAVGAVAMRQSPRMALGTAGLGSLLGMGGYMAWRYGVNGGKFKEEMPRGEINL